MKQLKILYKFTTRGRPNQFKASYESILMCQTNSVICVSIDDDDLEMQEHLQKNKYDVFWFKGKSNNKIHAINRDLEKIEKFDWDIIICWSDDMVIFDLNFEQIVSNCFYENETKNLDLFIHLPDGHRNKDLCTLSIMGRDYYNRFKYIYHPAYESVYCDNEATRVAKMLNCYRYFPIFAYEHRHPSNGYVFWDKQYEKNESAEVYAKDEKTFLDRLKKNFEIYV